MTGSAFWRLLGAVRKSRIVAEDGAATRTGAGTLITRMAGPATIDWEESGHWQTHEERPTPYRDRLRWKWDASRAVLSLFHLRRGETEPVHLADLISGRHGALLPAAPHRCGDDTYLVALTHGVDEITLTWRVTGPKKNYSLRHVYY